MRSHFEMLAAWREGNAKAFFEPSCSNIERTNAKDEVIEKGFQTNHMFALPKGDYLGARFARMRCSVRRCMCNRRAVSETLRLQSS